MSTPKYTTTSLSFAVFKIVGRTSFNRIRRLPIVPLNNSSNFPINRNSRSIALTKFNQSSNDLIKPYRKPLSSAGSSQSSKVEVNQFLSSCITLVFHARPFELGHVVPSRLKEPIIGPISKTLSRTTSTHAFNEHEARNFFLARPSFRELQTFAYGMTGATIPYPQPPLPTLLTSYRTSATSKFPSVQISPSLCPLSLSPVYDNELSSG